MGITVIQIGSCVCSGARWRGGVASLGQQREWFFVSFRVITSVNGDGVRGAKNALAGTGRRVAGFLRSRYSCSASRSVLPPVAAVLIVNVRSVAKRSK